MRKNAAMPDARASSNILLPSAALRKVSIRAFCHRAPKELDSGPFLACPKTYEFGSPDFAPGNRLQSLSCTNPHWFLGITPTAFLLRARPASSIPGPARTDRDIRFTIKVAA
jgi:hypothetical protein